MDPTARWRDSFWALAQERDAARALQAASERGALKEWTAVLTGVTIAACERLGWRASGRGHPLELLPVRRHEYLSLDVVAFPPRQQRWPAPIAAFELENQRNDVRIAYALWKLLCVRASLRVLFCFRREPEAGALLVHWLRDTVVASLGAHEAAQVGGETVVVVGSRNEASTFPYGFFRWWLLDSNTSSFQPI